MNPIPEPYKWDESFNVNNKMFNEQHQKLFELIADLDANRGDETKLKALIEFAAHHFKCEEDAFKTKDFKFSDAHKSQHDNFLVDAKKITTAGDAEMKFIKQWLVDHIKINDMKYKDVLCD